MYICIPILQWRKTKELFIYSLYSKGSPLSTYNDVQQHFAIWYLFRFSTKKFFFCLCITSSHITFRSCLILPHIHNSCGTTNHSPLPHLTSLLAFLIHNPGRNILFNHKSWLLEDQVDCKETPCVTPNLRDVPSQQILKIHKRNRKHPPRRTNPEINTETYNSPIIKMFWCQHKNIPNYNYSNMSPPEHRYPTTTGCEYPNISEAQEQDLKNVKLKW